jgi:DNA-binding response OmpR family regulator
MIAPKMHQILIAEDNGLLAFELQELLENAGLTVLGPTATSRQAMELLDQRCASAAVLDWNLLDGTSDPVARRLLEQNVPFVFFTSDVETVRALWSGVPVFEKHRSLLALVPIVTALLEMANAGSIGRQTSCVA